MSTNIYFIRHAHSRYTPDELGRPLSEDGWRDADRIIEHMKNESIDHILSSPYKRAIQTVSGLAEANNKKIEIVDGFKERKLTEGSHDNFEEAIKAVWNDPDFAWEGGESNNVAQRRGIRALEDVLKKYHGKNVAIGTHGNIMVLIMNYYDRQFDYHFWRQLSMPDIYKLNFEDGKYMGGERVWNIKNKKESI
ncbi:histidine phosphatase family protein [Sediminibacillus massiliensis]|uniref:histidine phosphatase family protein n=1 Tax=Sediminibacillus massiliensis TaxID=1926277 RepID=UPI0009884877|nr:histidine phosphatase family protein [Sediminibacillus massiliensis]